MILENEKKMIKRYAFRTVQYALGLLILAIGVAFCANSKLGISPVTSLPYVISLATGFKLGNCVTAVFVVFIALQILILRKDFNPINFTQLFFSWLFGFFNDFAKSLVGDFTIPTYAGQLVLLAIGIVVAAIGVSLYVDAGLVNMPMEGLVAAIAAKQKKFAFHQIKVFLDCLIVVISATLSLVMMHSLQGVREGTILCALLIGRLMPFILKRLAFLKKYQ